MNYFKPKKTNKSIAYKVFIIFITLLIPALPVHATSERGLYFTLTGSMDIFEDFTLTGQDPSFNTSIKAPGASAEIKTGLGFNHSIGYQFGNSFSTELEFAYKNGDFDKVTGDGGTSSLHGDITSKSFLINGIYSFNIRKFYSPYIGYGIGFAFQEATQKGKGSGEETTLAYQLKAGVEMKFNRKLSLLTGYKYFTTNEAKFGFYNGELASHTFEAGLKLHF
jgi:opacity protein-like surface antigen